MAEIIFDHVTKVFNQDIYGLEDASFKISKGEFVFVIGESGAGKSTLLKLLTKQIDTTSGEIVVQGHSLSELKKGAAPYYRRKFGIMENEFGLLKDRTVYDNIAIALRATEQPSSTMTGSVQKALGIVGLKNKENSFPDQISIGEAARVRLARALVTNPQILVADEPTANLDSGLAWDIMCLLSDINRTGITVIVASHARDLVTIMKKRVITLIAGSLFSDEKRAVYNHKALDIFEYRKVMNRRNVVKTLEEEEIKFI